MWTQVLEPNPMDLIPIQIEYQSIFSWTLLRMHKVIEIHENANSNCSYDSIIHNEGQYETLKHRAHWAAV